MCHIEEIDRLGGLSQTGINKVCWHLYSLVSLNTFAHQQISSLGLAGNHLSPQRAGEGSSCCIAQHIIDTDKAFAGLFLERQRLSLDMLGPRVKRGAWHHVCLSWIFPCAFLGLSHFVTQPSHHLSSYELQFNVR